MGTQPRVTGVLAALAIAAGASATAFAAEPTTGTFTGVIEGTSGAQLRWREEKIVDVHPAGPIHYVNLSGENFSIQLPGCPAADRATSCGGGYYEVFGTIRRARCTERWNVYVTNGETVTMTHAENLERIKSGLPPYLDCEGVKEPAPKSSGSSGKHHSKGKKSKNKKG